MSSATEKAPLSKASTNTLSVSIDSGHGGDVKLMTSLFPPLEGVQSDLLDLRVTQDKLVGVGEKVCADAKGGDSDPNDRDHGSREVGELRRGFVSLSDFRSCQMRR